METTPINSILSEEVFRKEVMLKAQPEIRTGTVLVFDAPDKDLVVLRSGKKLSSGEIKNGNFTKIYKIDITEKIYSTERSYYSGDSNEMFKLKITFKYAVADPAQIINRAIIDLNVVFETMLFHKLEQMASNFDIRERKEFSNKLEEMSNSTDWSQQLLEYGIRVTNLYVTVLLSEKAIMKNQIEIEEFARIQAEKDKFAREKQRIEDEANLERERIRVETELEADRNKLQKAKFESEKEQRLRRLQMETEEENLKREQLKEVMKSGDKNDILIYFAKNVEDLKQIFDQKRNEAREDREEMMGYIEKFKAMGLDDNPDFINLFRTFTYGDTYVSNNQDKLQQYNESDMKKHAESED